MKAAGLAFYDLDGTLCSTNVVSQYAFLIRKYPSRLRACLKYSKLILSVPVFVGLDFCSRRLFNEVFFREYRGMKQDWLRELSDSLFETITRPAIFPGAKALVDSDRREGFVPILVTGTPDFTLDPVVRHFGFEAVICNSLAYENGAATGRLSGPLIAGEEKVEAMKRLSYIHEVDAARSKAYSDSFSDLPMLEAVGLPVAVNPDRRLKRVAVQRRWPILDLRNNT